MAIEFARARYISRRDGGNVCRSAAYNARSDLKSQRTGERFFFGHRDGLLHHEILLPEGADERFRDMAVLWNEAQGMERRKDSQEAREMLLALPSNPELGLEHWQEMAREFVQEHFVSKGLAAQINIHAPHEGDVNFHAHVLISTRRLEGSRFAAHKARELDPSIRTMRGGFKAVTEGDPWGVLWRDYQNLYFERQGLEIRVDETAPVPQQHEGPIRMRTDPVAAQERLAENRAANEAAIHDPAWIIEKLTERQATFTELDIERLVRKHVPDKDERAVLRAAVLAQPEVIALHERESGAFAGRYTTAQVREEEQQVLAMAQQVTGARKAVKGRHARAVARECGLDREQEVAYLKATGTDGLVVIEGLAGTGKSHSLNAIREAHERSGWRVVGLAPTNVVADDLRRSGFKHGSTIHLELFWHDNGRYDRAPKWDRRTVVMVDEAAMMDTRLYGRLMRQAAETGAKVILAGDDRQLSSITRGGMFTAIKERHGSSVIGKVRRQEADWQRAASEDFAAGEVAKGLRAYAERGHVHWSADIDESRVRLLSDWDQGSRERPGINRFVYASTNVEVNRLNLAIQKIRTARKEVVGALEVETVRGKLTIGSGDRIQFHGNDRKAGIYNGSLATIENIVKGIVTAKTDTGRQVRFDTAKFDQFGLGYAGTVYRGQGKTQTEVYALYDNSFAWNARTAYVGLTRHSSAVALYVSRDLAADEIALAKQMSRRTHDEPSLKWATEAEVVELGKTRGKGGRSGQGDSGAPPAAPAVGVAEPGTTALDKVQPHAQQERPLQAFPREQVEKLRHLDLTVYARDVHGYEVKHKPTPGEYSLMREREDGRIDVLHARKAKDGHWTFIDAADAKNRGDIFDLARREGAPDLQAAREAVAAYDAAMRDPDRHKKAAEDKARPDIPKDAPDRAARKAGAKEQRRLDIAGAEHEDRRVAAGEAEEERQKFFREEAARVTRMAKEAREAAKQENDRLQAFERVRPPHYDIFVAAQTQRAGDARAAQPRAAPEQAREAVGVPKPAQLRYTEALNQHYDERAPIASLAKASMAEALAWQRDRHALDQRIAAEQAPARREALMLRRDIEHGDHMALVYGRLEFMARSGGQTKQAGLDKARAETYREQATEARRQWRERAAEHPDLYPPLGTERERDPQARTPEQERQAMRYLDLAGHAEKHGYKIQWHDDEHTRARLLKGDEELRIEKGDDGTWSYKSQDNIHDRGDIVDFEAWRGAKTFTKARDNLRPELAHAEGDKGPLDKQHKGQQQEQEQDLGLELGLDPDGPDGPERGPKRRKGRGR